MASDFWEQAAKRDPLWAVLSDPTKRERGWDPRAFFETGRREISLLLYQLRQLGRFPGTTRALDFGCGVGRLTQALAGTFDEVVGVDVSPTMIRLAQQLNRHQRRVQYILNQSPALEQCSSDHFDFVYSDIVLQHVEPDAAQRYIMEFLRVLSPRGVTVFQLPSHKRTASAPSRLPVNMPAEAYRTRLQILDGLPAFLKSGETAVVVVDVVNTSPEPWNQAIAGPIRLGNHWRDARGEMLIQDDGRTRLPSMVLPGDTVRLAVPVQAPVDAGAFVCEIDLVHEGISWFGHRGSPTACMPVLVAAAASSHGPAVESNTVDGPGDQAEMEFPDIYATLPPPDTVDDISAFPMYGVPRDVVVDLIAQHGGEAFFIEDDERGGPEWRGYRYYVSKIG